MRQCNSLVRTPYCALLMPPSCYQSQGVGLKQTQEEDISRTWNVFCLSASSQLRQSLQVTHSITATMFQVRSVFPRFLCASFFCVFCTPYFALLMAQVCREYRGWDSAGGGGGKGHRDLRSNSCYLPPAVAGQIIGEVVPKFKKKCNFHRFFPGNI